MYFEKSELNNINFYDEAQDGFYKIDPNKKYLKCDLK